ncbi:unnamed protein product, partial [Mesorhabditis belari]|uniref:Transglutaminase-like domain-containing protein n=1 Tax=Mesorhabditis belari TaxID=2138241 RepID=A0AAF3F3R6_9BILA
MAWMLNRLRVRYGELATTVALFPPNRHRNPPRIPLETRPKPGDWSMDDSWEHPPARKQPESFPQESPAVCLKCRDFSTPDHHASRFPRQSYNNIRQLAIELTSPFSDPIDKARAIFTWMHENIAYDVENFFNGTVKASTPEATLRSGLAVCAGYADLFAAMASHANLKAVVVQGHGKGYGYCRVTDGRIPKFKAGHAWNAVKFPHGWHLIDCCWGAGSVSEQKFNKRFAPSFFTQSPEEFRCRHFPSKASNQHCRDTISWETYILMDDGPTIYRDFTDARVDFSPYTLEPATLVLAPKTRYQFRVTRSCEHQGQTPLVVLLCVDGKEKLPLRNDGRGGLTCTGTTGSTGTTLSLMYITNLDGKPSGSFTVDYYESRVGRAAYSFSGLCQWTVG